MTDEDPKLRDIDGWHNYSNGGGSCVEVKVERPYVSFRDSKDRREKIITVPADSVKILLKGFGDSA